MTHEVKFEYESLHNALQDVYGLLEVTVEFKVSHNRLDDDYTLDILNYTIVNADTGAEVSYKSLPHNEQKEIQELGDKEIGYDLESYISEPEEEFMYE
jgi:hypothetical protein